jgi:hypothetical protein
VKQTTFLIKNNGVITQLHINEGLDMTVRDPNQIYPTILTVNHPSELGLNLMISWLQLLSMRGVGGARAWANGGKKHACNSHLFF